MPRAELPNTQNSHAMTSSPAFSRSEDASPSCSTQSTDAPEPVKEGLRQSIIAKRRALGEKQLQITFAEPQQFELTPGEMEKKERRREQNRRAAQRCRNKKRVNHKNVVQNYEKVIARNRELQHELDIVKRELKTLRNSVTCHSMCCPSLTSVKCELIKTETLTDEEFQDSIEDSFPIQVNTLFEHRDKIPAVIHDLSGFTQDAVGSFPSTYQQFDDSVHAERNYLLPVESLLSLGDVDHFSPWSYSNSLPPPNNHLPTSSLFSKSAQLNSTQDIHQGHRISNQIKHEKQRQHSLSEQTEHKQNCLGQKYGQYSTSLIATQGPSTPSTYLVNSQNHILDNCMLLQSGSSPCQVVPSLRSPRANCSTPRTSSSHNATSHRSLSGGSFSASETVGSCFEEKQLSSVSSDGSVYADNQASIFQDVRPVEVSDMDTDDVFLGASDLGEPAVGGHDVNNNIEVTPDNNRVTENELLQFLLDSGLMSSPTELADPVTGDLARAVDSCAGVGAVDDTALMQISSEELRQLMEQTRDLNSEQTSDITCSLLSDIQRIDNR